MSRFISVCLCALVTLVAVAGVSLVSPLPALAASGTLTMETPLHQSPDHGAPLLALLPEGAVVSIDGPPVDGFYPVSTGDMSGWMRGETLQLAKDEVADSAAAEGTPDGVDASVPIEQEASQTPPASENAVDAPADAAADPALTETPVAEPAATDPAADATFVEPVTQTTDTTATEAVTTEPSADETVAPDAAPAETVAADPAAVAPATEPLAAEMTPEPAPAPNVTPIPVVKTAPTGPASAAVDVPIRVGPGPEYDLISTAPTGSTVEQTGHLVDGYVSVQFNDVTGWAAFDQLGAPGAAVAAAPPAESPTSEPVAEPLAAGSPTPATLDSQAPAETAVTAEPTPEPTVPPTPTPEPPVGPASVVVDMPILSGPGPDYGLIFTVPNGSTVEQTGDLVDGYVSVQYKEVFGWAAREHLAEPIEFVEETPPAETAEPVDTKTPKPGSGVAYATIDLSLRAGPSANEEPIVAVPAGSKVVLTGVMEGDFQRVTFKEEIGWIANEYLASPENPAPNGEAKGKQENYSERQIVRIIYQAADRYDQSRSDLLRVARCESNLDPYAVNPSGSYGLFQFIRSTWKSTPYGSEDIFDPQANANAAAWMWKQGRKSEWVCQ
jgi:uncharacterized protein YraI